MRASMAEEEMGRATSRPSHAGSCKSISQGMGGVMGPTVYTSLGVDDVRKCTRAGVDERLGGVLQMVGMSHILDSPPPMDPGRMSEVWTPREAVYRRNDSAAAAMAALEAAYVS